MKNKCVIVSCCLILLIVCSSIASAETIHQIIEAEGYCIENLSVAGVILDENTGQLYSHGSDETKVTITGEIWSDQPLSLEIKMQIKTCETSVVIPDVSQQLATPSEFSLTLCLDDIPMVNGTTETVYLKVIDDQANERIINCGQLTYDTTLPQLTIEPLEITYDEPLLVNVSEPGYLYLIQSETYQTIEEQTSTAQECYQQLEILTDQGAIDRYYIPMAGNHAINANASHGFLRYIFRDFSGNLTPVSSYALYLNNEPPELIDYYVTDKKIHLIFDQQLLEQTLQSSDFYVSKEEMMNQPTYYYVIDDTTTIDYSFGYSDYENDPKGSSRYRFSHTPNGFTNNAGVDPLSGQTIAVEKYAFNYPGAYSIQYQAQDNPTENLIAQENFNGYKQWSNTTDFKIIAHRRPIAQLKSDQMISDDYYSVDLSTIAYDLDHMDLENKGIIAEELQWKQLGQQLWHSTPLPETLDASHDYVVRYRVKDLEQTWSTDAVELIDGETNQYLSINSFTDPKYPTPIPITERVQVFCDIYTNDTIASVQLTSPKGTVYDLNFDQAFESYDRYTLTYNIPQNLEDKNFHHYALTVKTDNKLTAQETVKVNVQTPIDLSVNCLSQYNPGDTITITATTSPYVKTVVGELFSNTESPIEQQMTFIKQENHLKHWEMNYVLPADFSSQHYDCCFTAITYNTNEQQVTQSFEVSGTELIDFIIEGKWNGTGPVFYALEKVKVTVEILGAADEVLIDLKEGLGDMTYHDPYGNYYAYTDFFDEDLSLPLSLEMVAPGLYVSEFNLPLVDSSIDSKGHTLRQPYRIELKVKTNDETIMTQEQSIDIEGNIYDHIHIQEKNY